MGHRLLADHVPPTPTTMPVLLPSRQKSVTIHLNYLAAHEAAISERVPRETFILLLTFPVGLEPSKNVLFYNLILTELNIKRSKQNQ
jgi:hypothetical protein